jgi:amino acid adenylation domain-containing protein
MAMSLDQLAVTAAISQCDFAGSCWIESFSEGKALHVVTDIQGANLSALDSALRARGVDGMLTYRVMDRSTYDRQDSSRLESWTVLVSTEADEMATLVRSIHALMSDILGVTRHGQDQAFLARGADSLMFMTLRDQIFARLSVDIAVADLYIFGRPWDVAALINAARMHANGQHVVAGVDEGVVEPPCAAQRRLYLAHCAHGSPIAYNVPVVFKFKSNFSVATVRHALEALVHRHDALRLRFRFENDVLVQDFPERIVVPFTVARVAPEQLVGAIEPLVQAFCLERGPLVRAVYFKIEGERPALLLDVHHLCIDGISLRTIVRDFSALLENRPLPEAKSYVAAIRALNTAAAMQATQHAEYWKRHQAGGASYQDLPFRRSGAKQVRWSASETHHALSPAQLERWKAFATENGTTLHTFMLSLVHLALEKFCCASDSLIGVPYSGRGVPECDDVVGGFVVTLPSRLSTHGETRYREVLASLHEEALHHARHQHCDFSAVGTESSSTEQVGRITVAYSTQSFGLKANEVLECFPVYHPIAQFDLLIYLREQSGRFDLVAAYADEVLEGKAVESLIAGIPYLAEQVLELPDAAVGALRLIQSQEGPAASAPGQDEVFDRHATVCSRFEEMARKYPGKVTVRDKTRSLTYEGLNDAAESLALQLQDAGVKHGDAVGILAERSVSLVVAMLAVLKVGGYYVPLDRSMPSARLASLVADAGVALCLVDGGCNVDLSVRRMSIPCDGASDNRGRQLAAIAGSPFDVAYLLFTSGSTGKPKGVLVSHRNILQLVLAENAVPLDECVVVLVTGAPTFDAITYEIWGALLNGGSAVFAETSTLLDVVALRREIERCSPNLIWLTAGLFDRLVVQNAALFAGVAHLIVGGDVVNPESVMRVYAATPETTIVNGYGPTESTTFSTFHVLPRDIAGPVPIGRCLAMTRAYVLDEAMSDLPRGAVGELYLAGEGVAIGYLDEKSQGITRFVHRSRADGTLERLYKTGDLVRLNESGVYEYHGRKDAQVKIAGRRVDPAEIKLVVERCTGVEAVHILPTKGIEGLRLNAYLVVNGSFEVEKLISNINEKLPAYMRPGAYFSVPYLPLNRNGKVDAAALHDIGVELSGAAQAPDTDSWNATEFAVASVWKEVTGKMPTSLDKGFFELGGDSLRLVHLFQALNEMAPGALSLPDLLSSTARAQAQAIRRRLEKAAPAQRVKGTGEAAGLYTNIQDEIGRVMTLLGKDEAL